MISQEFRERAMHCPYIRVACERILTRREDPARVLEEVALALSKARDEAVAHAVDAESRAMPRQWVLREGGQA